MARFKIGQQVVCINEGAWLQMNHFTLLQRIGLKRKKHFYGPKLNEIVTVMFTNENLFICFREYQKLTPHLNGYHEQYFEPLADISELESILKEQPEHV